MNGLHGGLLVVSLFSFFHGTSEGPYTGRSYEWFLKHPVATRSEMQWYTTPKRQETKSCQRANYAFLAQINGLQK